MAIAGGLQLPALVQRIVIDASQAATAEREVSTFAGKADQHFSGIARKALNLAGVAGLGAIAVSVVKTGADFERSFNTAVAVAGVPGPELEKLRQLAVKLGADTAFSANEAAAGMLELSKAGISTSDIMGGALKNALDLATAGDLELAEASTVVSNAMNTFGIAGNDSARVADALAGAANASSADVRDLSQALAQGGQAAFAAGFSIEETTAALALFADRGLRGSDAGTSLKTALLGLVPTSEKAKEVMAQLGLEFVNQDGSIKSLTEIQAELKEGLGGLTQAQQQSALKTIFGTDAYRAMSILLGTTEQELQGYITATSDAGAASEVAAAKMQGLPGTLERIKGGAETLVLNIYNALEPALALVASVIADVIERASEMVGALSDINPAVVQVGGGLLGIVTAGTTAAGVVGIVSESVTKAQGKLEGMGRAGHLAATGIGALSKVAGVGAIVLGIAAAGDALVDAMAGTPPAVAEVGAALVAMGRDVGAGRSELAATSPAFEDLNESIRLAAEGADAAGGPLGALFVDLFGGDGPADVQRAADAIEVLDQHLAQLVGSGNPEAAEQQLATLAQTYGLSDERVAQLREQLDAYGTALAESGTQQELADESARKMAEAQEFASGTTAALGQAAALSEEQLKALEERYKTLGKSVEDFVSPADAFKAVLERNEEAARVHAEKIAESTENSKDSWEDYAKASTVSLGEFSAELQKQIDAYDSFATNLFQIAARGRTDVAAELAQMGKDGAVLAAQFVTASGEEFNKFGDTLVEAAQKKPELAGQNLDNGFRIIAEIGRQGGTATVESVMAALGPLPGLTEELVRDTAARANQQLEEARPAFAQSWTDRKTVSLQEMNAMLAEAPPVVRQATETINQHLIDTNPAFAEQFQSRKGVSVAEMQGLLADAPLIVRQAADLVNQHLTDTQPLFVQNWGDRKNVSLEQMNAMLAEAPPVVRNAADTINRHLQETNPGFAEQFASRKGVSVQEMNRLLAEAPPPVRAAAETINRHLVETTGPFNDSWLGRGRYALDRMREMARDAPPQAAAAGEGLNRELASRLPAFEQTVSGYQTVLVQGVNAIRIATGELVPRAGGGIRVTPQAEGGIVEFYARGGMKEAHQAQIARAGDWRVWAEPETGGEAYIPLSAAKRQRSTQILEEVARRFGLAVTDYASLPAGKEYREGGLWCEDEHEGCRHFHSGGLYVPPPHPSFADFGPPIQPAGAGTTHNMREAVAEAARRHMQEAHHQAPPGGAPGADPGGSGGDIVAVGRRMQGMGYRVGEHPAFGGVAPVHTKNSYHYRGRAIDVNWYPAAQEPAKLDYLAGWIRQNVRPITELLWRTAGHFNHLHLAMKLGGIIEKFTGAEVPALAGGGRMLANRLQLVGEDGPELVVPSAPALVLEQRRTAEALGERARTMGMGISLRDGADGVAERTKTVTNVIGERAVMVTVNVTGADNPEEAGRRAGGAAAREILAVVRAS